MSSDNNGKKTSLPDEAVESQEHIEQATQDTADDKPAKPKLRKPRPKKKKSDEEGVLELEESQDSAQASTPEAEPAKPKTRKPRAKKKKPEQEEQPADPQKNPAGILAQFLEKAQKAVQANDPKALEEVFNNAIIFSDPEQESEQKEQPADKENTQPKQSAPAEPTSEEEGAEKVRRVSRQELTRQLMHDILGIGESLPDDKGNEPELVIPDQLPVIPLKDVVLFNFMILPLFISREKSVQAIESILRNQPQLVLVLTQKDDATDPQPDNLYQVGTVVSLLRLFKMPDNRLKVLVQGVTRARVKNFVHTEPFLQANIEPMPDQESEHDAATVEALLRLTKEYSEKVLSMRGMASPDLLNVLQGVDEPGRLADIVVSNLRMKTQDAQAILEVTDPVERLRLVNVQLQHEVEVVTVQMRIQSTAKEGMDKAQKDFFLREQLKAIRHELGDSEANAAEEIENLKEALEKAGLPKEVKKESDKQLRRLSMMHGDSAEATVTRSYLELLADLPWQKLSKDNLDIHNAKNILDEDHFGLDKVKDRILEFLSVHKLNPTTHGSILCFVGPPGVGKTSLGKSIARALGRQFERLSLGGMHDEAEIRGHRRTYIGAMPGRIIQAIRHAGTRNPVIVLDEMDKVGHDFRGDPQSALLEVLDPEQNNTFSDHYLNVPFDLSKVMFLCTANQLETIPPALRDRMEIISLPGYTQQEKEEIAKRHLMQKRIEDNGLQSDEVEIKDEALVGIIRNYTREAGVRELERKIGAVCRKLARRKAEEQKPPFTVKANDLQELLGPALFLDDELEEKLLPGMAYGLAWTSAGGAVLTIEVSVMKGKGNLQLTGSLGDVMKESARAAVSYIRSKATDFGVDPDFSENLDIHIHVPDGATPKDGPSAGVTLTTALLSALKNQAPDHQLCMTGEIDIKGRVLPVGGIKEKLLGAVARDLQKVIIPWQNQKDLDDIPKEIRDKLTIIPCRYYSEIYAQAFAETAQAGDVPAKPKRTTSRRKKTTEPKTSATATKKAKSE